VGNAFWRGTEDLDFGSMLGKMDEFGAEIGAESHNNVYFVQMKSMASTLEDTMRIYADVLRRPAIDEVWVQRIQQILLARVLPNLDVQGPEIASAALREALYTTHPYQRIRYGTPENVRGFTTEDVRSCYETFTRPNNCVLAIYGDVDPDAVRAVVAAACRDGVEIVEWGGERYHAGGTNRAEQDAGQGESGEQEAHGKLRS